MKQAEIKSLTVQELQERIVTEVDNLQKLQFAHKISPIENPARIKENRRLIARLKTELRAKELAVKA
jgi:large subunit ribosomal protein L29